MQGGPSATAAAYVAAWRSASKTEASRRVTTLVAMYLSMLTGEDRIIPLDDLLKRLAAADSNILFPMVRSDGGETERRRETVLRVLTTLYFVVVFVPLDAQYSPLRVVMVKWKAFGVGGQVADPNAVFAVKVRTLIQRKLQGDGAFGEQDLRFLMSDLLAPTGGALPAPLEQSCIGLLGALAAQHLAANRTSDMVGVALTRLKRDGAENTFLMMTTFLRRHLAGSPFTDAVLLDEATAAFRPFHLWPQPFASVALDMLKTLAMEAKSPGVTWRHEWEAAFPALVSLAATGKELSTFVMTAPDSVLGAVLDSVTISVPTERDVTMGAVLNMFRCCGIGEEEQSDDVDESGATLGSNDLRLDFLSLKKLRGIYAKVRNALEQAVQMSSAGDALFFLIQRLEKLRGAAQKHIAKQSARTNGVPGFAANPPLSHMLCGIPYQHHVYRCSFDCALAGRDMGTKWPRRNAQKPLKEIVGELTQAQKSDRVMARILVEGGDNELHHMLGAYVAVLQSDPEAAAKVKFRFYLLPGRRPSMMSAYLSSVDPWFARTIAVGLRAPLSCMPTLADTTPVPAEAVAIDEGSYRLPPFVMHSMLSDYVSQARHTNRFKVFQCECWQKSVSNTESAPSKYVIPFFMTAEVGLSAQARTFQMFNDLPASLSVAEIAGSKAFKYKPPILSVRMVSASLRGAMKPEPELEARPWQELYLGAINVAGAPCDAPRLSSSWLEMSATSAGEPVSGAANQKKRSRNQYRYHVRSVEIEGHNKSTFDVCLDGVVYGPFQKIAISPCVLGETLVHFPIASFHNTSS